MTSILMPAAGTLSRRLFLAGMAASLAACRQTPAEGPPPEIATPRYADLYPPMPDERFPVPGVQKGLIPAKYVRQQVDYATAEPVGTVVVDPGERYLYLVQEGGKAMRYGVGVGRDGFAWNGVATIQMKREWPRWTPPAEMILRQPELEQYRPGMEPSLENPLGARALYLFQGGKDTLYRIHGSNEPRSIGTNVSSGCVRLLNQDIIDLYARVPLRTRVVVLPAAGPTA